MIDYTEVKKQRVVLVGVETGQEENFAYGMEELAGLAKACEMEVVATMTQKLPEFATCPSPC